MKEETKKKISESCKKRYLVYPKKKSSRKIYWVEGDRVFDNAKDVATFFDCSVIAVYKVLEGKNRTICGCNIRFILDKPNQ